ncbi:MAG TPA: hypothetical protein VE732_06335, partial [Nitrososphaera sp.]|nr:hypothetical protein [Nitrososphaera sp.]
AAFMICPPALSISNLPISGQRYLLVAICQRFPQPIIKVVASWIFIPPRAAVVFPDLEHKHAAFRDIIMLFFAKSIRIAFALFSFIF